MMVTNCEHGIPLENMQTYPTSTVPSNEIESDSSFRIQSVSKRTIQDNIVTHLFGDAYPEAQEIMSLVSTSRPSSCHGFFIQSTIFITMPIFPGGYQQQSFHSCIIDLIEFAETYTDDCDSLIIILEKCTKNMGKRPFIIIHHYIVLSNSSLDTVLRTLVYYGFQLIDPRIYNQSASYVLVGYEL
ncbi:hypothetical protein K492DRAFT_10932 [Lichtheimia hyalospora FSU 10163]|nr:hypothetical protein K492DRAFT_10932 [Lichtheimia hyalospora FSU 10163]